MKSAIFDRLEIMLLEVALTPSEVAIVNGEKGFIPDCIPSKELCLRIGGALTLVLERNAPVDLALSERDCWMFRERVNLFSSLGGNQALGLQLKAKLYGLLLQYAADKMVGEIPVVDTVEEPTAAEVRDALRERESASQDANPSPDGADNGAGDPACP